MFSSSRFCKRCIKDNTIYYTPHYYGVCDTIKNRLTNQITPYDEGVQLYKHNNPQFDFNLLNVHGKEAGNIRQMLDEKVLTWNNGKMIYNIHLYYKPDDNNREVSNYTGLF
jgi:hypothetical protein